ERRDRTPHDGGEHAVDLRPDLADVALDGAGSAADGLAGEYAGEDGADDAAHAVHTEHVEAVVIAERTLYAGREEVADRARSKADEQRADRIDEAGRRRDGDETGDGTGRATE